MSSIRKIRKAGKHKSICSRVPNTGNGLEILASRKSVLKLLEVIQRNADESPSSDSGDGRRNRGVHMNNSIEVFDILRPYIS